MCSHHSSLYKPMRAVHYALWVPDYAYVNKISAPVINEFAIWSSADCCRRDVSKCLNCVQIILIESALIRRWNSAPFGFIIQVTQKNGNF